MRHGAGASKCVRTAYNTVLRPSPPPRAPGGGRGRPGGNAILKCVVMHFAARGPKEPQKPWRDAAARAAGTQCESGGAAKGPKA